MSEHKLIPLEPTYDMLRAAEQCVVECKKESPRPCTEYAPPDHDEARAIWKIMWAAAPTETLYPKADQMDALALLDAAPFADKDLRFWVDVLRDNVQRAENIVWDIENHEPNHMKDGGLGGIRAVAQEIESSLTNVVAHLSRCASRTSRFGR